MSRKLRIYIQEEDSRHAKQVKEAKLKVVTTKEKVIERYYALGGWIMLAITLCSQ